VYASGSNGWINVPIISAAGVASSTIAVTAGSPRIRGTESGGDQLSRFTLDMEGEFVIQLSLDVAWTEDGASAQPEIAEFH